MSVLLGILVVILTLVVVAVERAFLTTNLDWMNGLPYCPLCRRQVSLRRRYCRACGYEFVSRDNPFRDKLPPTPPHKAGASATRSASEVCPWYNKPVTQLARELRDHLAQVAARPHESKQLTEPLREIATTTDKPPDTQPPPLAVGTYTDYFEALRIDPTNIFAKTNLCNTIEVLLNKRILGARIIEADRNANGVLLRRELLQYEAFTALYVDDNRHGFEVEVKMHSFKILITCPRFVPEGMQKAPWEDLLANLCKIDRSVIAFRNLETPMTTTVAQTSPRSAAGVAWNSDTSPLAYVVQDGSHPYLRVEVLQKPSMRTRRLPGA
ncbi:MAG: hypothetical protein KGM43_03010 [Planctomycetota bacterium]|nr:hypothetical protein [Planctomycetota bacterium]